MMELDSNIVDLEQQLDAMGKASADLTGAWTEVGRWWRARQTTVFATRNRGEWPMRDADTKNIGKGPLMRTGTLFKAVSSPKPAYSSPTTARFGAVGSAGWYGVFHQRGKGVPKRQPVPPITASESKDIIEIISDHIMEAGK